jgi:hypothetical protein
VFGFNSRRLHHIELRSDSDAARCAATVVLVNEHQYFWKEMVGFIMFNGRVSASNQTMSSICPDVSSQASLAHFPARSFSLSNLASPHFFSAKPAPVLPVTSWEINRLKSGSCPTSRMFSGGGASAAML